jgi:hypothetical protein
MILLSSAGCGRSDGHCLFNLLFTVGGLLISTTSLLLCPSILDGSLLTIYVFIVCQMGFADHCG